MATFPMSPAQAAILGQQPRPAPAAIVNAGAVPAQVAALTGQTPPVTAQPNTGQSQIFQPDPAANFLLERANRPEDITTGIGLLGRLAALGVGQGIQKKNLAGQREAAESLIATLPPEQQPMARFALSTGDPETVLRTLQSQQGLAVQKRGQDLNAQSDANRLETTASEGALNRKHRNIIATQGNESRERMNAANNAIRQRANEIAALEATALDTKGANELQDDFRSESKDIKLQTAAMQRIQASAEDPSAAGDLSLIFNFMKVLDPGSTVREGEFANAQNAGGVGDRMTALYNSVLDGTRLSEPQRADFVNRAGRLFAKARDQHTALEQEFIGIGGTRGVDASTFLVDYLGALRDFEPAEFTPEDQAATQGPPPPPGFVE